MTEAVPFHCIVDLSDLVIFCKHNRESSAFIIYITSVPVFSTKTIIRVTHEDKTFFIEEFDASNYRNGTFDSPFVLSTKVMDISFVIQDDVHGPLSCQIISDSICYQYRGPLVVMLPVVSRETPLIPDRVFFRESLYEEFERIARGILEEDHIDTIFRYLPSYDINCLDRKKGNKVKLYGLCKEALEELSTAKIKYCMLGECPGNQDNIKRDYNLYCIPSSDNEAQPTIIDSNTCNVESIHMIPNIVSIISNEDGLVRKIVKNDDITIYLTSSCTASHFNMKSINVYMLFIPVDRSKAVILSICRCYTSTVVRNIRKKRDIENTKVNEKKRRLV